MGEDSHAARARERLERIDVDGDAELEALRAEAVAAVDALIDRLEAGDTEHEASVETDAPESWDETEWTAELETARAKAGIATSKGTLTTKTINDRDYYYLQWRDGENVRSQYVAPVDPA
jgi:hypothetical protein